MRTTEEQRNKLRILKRVIDRAFKKLVARGLKLGIHKIKHWDTPGSTVPQHLDSLLTSISGRSKAPISFKEVEAFGTVQAHILRQTVAHAYSGDEARGWLEYWILEDLYANGVEYELLSQMPRPKREYKPRPKQTRVESYAAKVDAKVIEWDRKLKLARTKLAKYKKRQRYYENKKKGARTNA